MASVADLVPSCSNSRHHKNNFLIHQLFLRQVLLVMHSVPGTDPCDRDCQECAVMQDLDDCVALIDGTLADTHGRAEYALYIKALIHRHRGVVHALRLLPPGSMHAYHYKTQACIHIHRGAVKVSPALPAGCHCLSQQCHIPQTGMLLQNPSACLTFDLL